LNPLFALFAHDRGPTELQLAVAELRERPRLWTADPRLAPGTGDVSALGQLRYFGASDPAHPNVPLVRADANRPRACDATDPRLPPDTGIRDKFWQRLVVEAAGHLPQPGFAVVNGSRVEASHAPWTVRADAVDFRPVRTELLSAAVPGSGVVVEAADIGFTAVVRDDGIRLALRGPHLAAHRPAPEGRSLTRAQWAQFVDALCSQPLPLGATMAAFNPSAELGDALLSAPGSYILKPQFGSNGVGVVRLASCADGYLTVESDCPDTAQYLDEFPRDARQRGRDLVTAAAAHRSRFVDRALAGIPERTLDRSILEEEIPAHRVGGSVFEPRIVVQRVKTDSGEAFATLGAICKRIDTAVGASVARDFREEPLDVSLHHFLRDRVPTADLARRVEQARVELLAAGDQLRAAVVPLVEARGARVHQFGIDCRLCWNAGAERVEYPFLEFQFGIGRIDVPLAGYKTRDELARLFGPEAG
jgi:hypothetical protein